MIRNNKVEILAPAGSYDIMKAVIHAGADAVYLGGDLFGARAFANNFDQEELIRAIEYAHLHDKSIYLTVNTLLKEKELRNYLIQYLTPFYEAGLDAVIVQDFGVLKVVHECFPDLDIHASTQMAITGRYGSQMLKDAGATRIVTARELSAKEIKAIHDYCDIEIESFVHGALCYCYSGQCLFSSMNGGRSGNRGRCTQPCRMNYDVHEDTNQDGNGTSKESTNESGKIENNRNEKYVLSPKDMCALDIIPDVIESGVFSLKIEGRMKNITYAAGVTSLYRKYVDLYLANGRKGYHVSEKDMKDLMDIYNRGSFTSGYYKMAKGREMISLSRPNHMGLKALAVENNKNGLITFRALEKIHPQDVFEIDRENSFTSGGEYRIGEKFQVNLPRKYKLKNGDVLYRTRNSQIVSDVNDCYVEDKLRRPVDIKVDAKLGEPLSVTMYDGSINAKVCGNIVEPAMKQPLSKEKLESQFSKLGDTEFSVRHIEVNMDDAIFIPVGHMNELRRDAAQKLSEALIDRYRRKTADHLGAQATMVKEQLSDEVVGQASQNQREYPSRNILVTNIRQARYVASLEQVNAIYLDYHLVDRNKEELTVLLDQCKESGKLIALALPHMLRDKNNQRFETLIARALELGITTFLVRNMEELGSLGKMSQLNQNTKFNIITDTGLYIWNSFAKEELLQMIEKHGMHLLWETLPYEETEKEIRDVSTYQSERASKIQTELVVYTRLPLMLSEQCVRKTFGKCDGANGEITITDRKNKDYLIKSYCTYCYTVLYDNKYMNLTDLEELIAGTGANYIRYEFVDDNEQEDKIENVLSDEVEESLITRGHFLLGVE